MAKRSIQGYVELASGLGELTRSAAKEAAAEILALAGSDASRKKAAKQVSGLADELLHAAQSNRKALVRLVRREVDAAVAKLDLNKVSGEVQTLAATVAGLASQVDDLARSATGMQARTPGPVADAIVDLGPEPARVAARPSAPAKKAPAKKAPAKKAPAKKASTAAKKAPAKKASTAVKKAPAKKALAKKAPAAKSTATKSAPAKTTTARKAPATKAATTSTAAKKTTTAKTTTARKAPARKAPATKAAATSTASTPAAPAPTPAATTPAASTPAATTPATSTPAADA
ncbi:MAG TPA: hypothetical protein VFL10_06640 [Ornithinibacter sp.]|nr:hypothetical protein [Ornithinibacter sp.]